ncbi:MAG: hypothetical protein M3442_12935 [Chloroflexota bacterium]|nr:hypothetical protein [Chloroflexota bacterium]
MPMLFLTTQPGWAFATLAEMRRQGVTEYAAFHHRDSSILLPASTALLRDPLQTPADVFGCLRYSEGDDSQDATAGLRRALDPARLRHEVERWLPAALRSLQTNPSQSGPRRTMPSQRYSIGSEVWGQTALHRSTLRALLGDALREAFPRWHEESSGGLRFFCKADGRIAIVGLRLYSNLRSWEAPRAPESEGHGRDPDSRPGTLREHLACGLLTLAQVEPGDAVLDPFMGTGTILRLAAQRYGAPSCIGFEVDNAAYQIARETIDAPDVRLARASFEQSPIERLPQGTRLVSNLPFGARFREVPSERLLRFLDDCWPRLESIVLLLGRDQGEFIAHRLGIRAKNVLVLGQPACIVGSPL